nr:MAG TPA_asm: hypothetical protein [Caudoviricetes sp.]
MLATCVSYVLATQIFLCFLRLFCSKVIPFIST